MEFYYKTESYAINGAAMRVYNVLGPGFVEPIYQEALEIELQRRNIPFIREPEIEIYYDGVKLKKRFRPDFICYDKIIVELKAVMELDDWNRVQVYNYLKATKMKVGLLYNFGHSEGLEYERKVM
jgi:GxxExxY protein